MRFKAHGLLPVLQEWFPKLQAAVQGGFVDVGNGIQVEVKPDMEIDLEATSDGKVLITLPGGVRVKVSKEILGIIPFKTTEQVTKVGIDAAGVDVIGPAMPNVRLEAYP